MTTPPMGTPPVLTDQNKPLTVGDWIITLLVLYIPLVNLVMLFYWALSSTSNTNRKNYCIATLIFVAIFVGIFILLMFMGVFASLMTMSQS